jgi:4,5-DOPA dioxygenase extradiol
VSTPAGERAPAGARDRDRLPTLFISHGSPMHALEAGAAGASWARLAAQLPRPRALLMVSAHWETAHPALTESAQPQTIHDFYGFPEPLYRLRYPAPGAPDVAARARGLLAAAGFEVERDASRGLDHGAWSPLLHMYPDATIPVAQLSVQTQRDPAHHLAVGRALRPLAAQGVLIIGSGHMTHNLRDRTPGGEAAAPLAYAQAFRDWIDARLQARDLDALAGYRAQAPHARRAHPSEEHFLPLFVALGAAGDAYRPALVHQGIESGALAMDCYCFEPS